MKVTMSTHCHHEPSSKALSWDDEQLKRAALMCHALSDPERLKLLLLLHQEGTLCVSELVERSGGKTSSVSVRLQTLVQAGLLSRQREAKHVYYRLSDQHIHDLLHNILDHATEMKQSTTLE
ncbi:MAG: metalloregulator ArsR/SmtB family transcription factor [Cardiobacteriaceae bacterium]|nr:metalloregulator ArsR/SmtB family transcription factor [Cardiobacteriaceae bacterium]